MFAWPVDKDLCGWITMDLSAQICISWNSYHKHHHPINCSGQLQAFPDQPNVKTVPHSIFSWGSLDPWYSKVLRLEGAEGQPRPPGQSFRQWWIFTTLLWLPWIAYLQDIVQKFSNFIILAPGLSFSHRVTTGHSVGVLVAPGTAGPPSIGGGPVEDAPSAEVLEASAK